MAKKKPRTDPEVIGKFEAGINGDLVALDTLKPDPKNTRLHDDRNIAAIAGSLKLFGQQTPIVCQPNGTVLKGNGTLTAATKLGWTHLAVIRTKLTGKAARAYQIADNRSSELSTFDPVGLASQLAQLPNMTGAIGFSDEDIEAMTGVFNVEAGELPGLPTGDGSGIQQMTFTVTDDQVEAIKEAITRAKDAGPFDDTGNENGNGNALARIAESYRGAS